jgi:hypothetical protein
MGLVMLVVILPLSCFEVVAGFANWPMLL